MSDKQNLEILNKWVLETDLFIRELLPTVGARSLVITWTKAEQTLADGTGGKGDGSEDAEMGPRHFIEAIMEDAQAYQQVVNTLKEEGFSSEELKNLGPPAGWILQAIWKYIVDPERPGKTNLTPEELEMLRVVQVEAEGMPNESVCDRWIWMCRKKRAHAEDNIFMAMQIHIKLKDPQLEAATLKSMTRLGTDLEEGIMPRGALAREIQRALLGYGAHICRSSSESSFLFES